MRVWTTSTWKVHIPIMTTITTMTTYTTQKQKGWRFGGSWPWISHHPVGPGKDTHGRLGPSRRKAVGGPINAPQSEVTHNDGTLKRDKRKSSDKHGGGAGDDHTRQRMTRCWTSLPSRWDHQQERHDHRAWGRLDRRWRVKTDTKVNTEFSAVVNHLAKLNDSGDVQAITDTDKKRGRDCKTTKSCPFRLKANSDDYTTACTEPASRDEKCGWEAHGWRSG